MRIAKSKKISAHKLIFLCLITTIILTFLTLSKYQSTVAGNDNTKVAIPIINLSSDEIMQVSINPTEKEKMYIFKVTNYNEEQNSQVSMEYNIEIESLNNLPLEFEIYTYENNVKGEENLLSGNGNITENILMNYTESTAHQYILIIKWEASATSYKFSQVADYVKVILHSNQVD